MLKKKKRYALGQSLVEYLILLAVVVLGAIAGLSYFKDQINKGYNAVGASVQGSAGG